MAVLPIYTYGTPVLRKKARPVTGTSDDIIRLIMDMFETMRTANGIGLAANQVGRLERVLVVDVSDIEELRHVKPLAIINPEVVRRSGSWTLEEGCLSIPDVRDEVERPEAILLRYKDSEFRDVEMEAGGLLSRVILHEIDHLNGILFLDHLTEAKREIHADALKRIQRGEMEVTYPVVGAAGVAVH